MALPDLQKLTAFRGDSTALTISTAWAGAALPVPASTWDCIFSLKRLASDADTAALVQKQTGAGLTPNSGGAASVVVDLMPADSAAIVLGVAYVWDIQAQHLTTGEVRTVAHGTLTFTRDVTQLTTVSIPVVTTQPPLPAGRTIEIRAGATHLEWRYADEDTWTELIALADLIGPQGYALEIRRGATAIESKYENEANWTELIPLIDLVPDITWEAWGNMVERLPLSGDVTIVPTTHKGILHLVPDGNITVYLPPKTAGVKWGGVLVYAALAYQATVRENVADGGAEVEGGSPLTPPSAANYQWNGVELIVT